MGLRRSKVENDPAYPKCEWDCGSSVGGSPYRTPMIGTPGGRYLVCGPDCPNRPEGSYVFAIELEKVGR